MNTEAQWLHYPVQYLGNLEISPAMVGCVHLISLKVTTFGTSTHNGSIGGEQWDRD